MKEKTITDTEFQELIARYDGERFGVVETDSCSKSKVIIMNPREAGELAEFIIENLIENLKQSKREDLLSRPF